MTLPLALTFVLIIMILAFSWIMMILQHQRDEAREENEKLKKWNIELEDEIDLWFMRELGDKVKKRKQS